MGKRTPSVFHLASTFSESSAFSQRLLAARLMMGFSVMTELSTRPLRFHWSMSSAGQQQRAAKSRAAVTGVPDLEALTAFFRHADECGIESRLTAFGFHRPDPLTLAAALAMRTSRIKFMVAVRS